MRILLTTDPLLDVTQAHHEDSPWPARWVGHPDHLGIDQSVVIAYRRRFILPEAGKFRLHLSADQRYELLLDGQRIGRGPERGDRLNWFFETYELSLEPGLHVIVARTWWLRDDAPTAYAQMTVAPRFWCMGEALSASPPPGKESEPQKQAHALFSTGIAPWECKRIDGYSFVPSELPHSFLVCGAKVRIDGAKVDWNFARGQDGDGWVPAVDAGVAAPAAIAMEARPDRLLRPALLPPEIDVLRRLGIARHVADAATFDRAQPVRSQDHLPDEARQWDALLAGKSPLTIPPDTARRVIIDLDDYYCAYPQLTVSGGAGASVEALWAESLYENPAQHVKGNRDQIEGKVFAGIGDTFLPDGGANRVFETLWWEAGRYVQLLVRTKEQPLTIESLALRETHYPYEFQSQFDSSDSRLAEVVKPALRTLQMCSHETYMDCPYYEQLMYAGDTRLQVLVTYATTRDPRLPRKALETFDFSRAMSPGAGLTMARYPSKVLQTIPPFSLWWVGMVHDGMMWREAPGGAFTRARLRGVRAVLEAFLAHLTPDDLVESPRGWNFVDWVSTWPHGTPPQASPGGFSGNLNFHTIYALRLAAELEEFAGEPELAARYRKLAGRIARAANDAFFDPKRGLFAEERFKETFSEHTQCLALLGAAVTDGRGPHVLEALLSDPHLARTTIYYSHYLFEVLRQAGRVDLLLKHLELWFGLKANGNRTTFEMPEPTRSDCHAWGAHPVYHFYASILGIRPAAPAFARVRIEPQLGGLTHAKGILAHPLGEIAVDVSSRDGKLTGEVRLPPGVAGELIVNGQRIALPPEPQDACMMPHPF